MLQPYARPPWLGDARIHESHQRNLMRKVRLSRSLIFFCTLTPLPPQLPGYHRRFAKEGLSATTGYVWWTWDAANPYKVVQSGSVFFLDAQGVRVDRETVQPGPIKRAASKSEHVPKKARRHDDRR
jgi:hypothetical protein